MKKLCLLMAILLALAFPLSGCSDAETGTGKNISVFDESEAAANEDYFFSDTGESEITVNKANSADTKSESVSTQTTAETTEKKTTAKTTTAPVSTTEKPSTTKKQAAQTKEKTSASKAEKATEKETTERAETTKKKRKETTTQAVVQDDQSDMVWIPNSGSKYHRSASCSGMKNPSHVSLSTAKARGYTPCKKCYR